MGNSGSDPISLDDARRKREEKEREEGEWLEGPASCTACKHRWEAVAPVGTWALECPSCGTERGIWRGPCVPQDGELWWSCGTCGGPFLYATPDGLHCVGCGLPQHPWEKLGR
jgi:hypothetical protein